MAKYALVTGASSGFGYEVVQMLLQTDWHVMATLKSEAEQAHFVPHPRLTLQCMDLTQAEQIQATADRVQRDFPHLDLLINNAGFGTYGALEDVSAAQLRLQMEVNFFGPVLLTRSLLPALRKAQGRIITVTSIMGQYSMPLVEAYSASKYALEGLFEGLYYEMQPLGVQVCTVQPGGYRTDFFKALQWGDTSLSKDSPYYAWGQNFQGFMDRLAQRPRAPHPQEVAQKIASLLKQKRMPRSVVVGKDAVLIAALRKALPGAVFHGLIQRMNRKVLGL
jgi:NAD(P)-dependent dehydrogenase (short-subunit alcohol dehydrogenase family)